MKIGTWSCTMASRRMEASSLSVLLSASTSSFFLSAATVSFTFKTCFCSAMLRRARLCHVRSSVCPSVTLRYYDHIGWDTSKLLSFSWVISVWDLCYLRTPTSWVYSKATARNFSRNRSVVWKSGSRRTNAGLYSLHRNLQDMEQFLCDSMAFL